MTSFVIAPFLYIGVSRLRHGYSIVEMVLFFSIAGLVVVHILPESVSLAGWLSILVFFVSWLLPTVGERLLHKHADSVHLIPIVVSVIGLVVHSLIDGLSLASLTQYVSQPLIFSSLSFHPLPLAVVIHSYPASLFVWWVLRPKFGPVIATSVMITMALTTSIGFFSGAPFIAEIYGTTTMGLFQALAAGSLMHLASHRVGADGHEHHAH